jgi:hypothetical protein
MGPPTPQIGCGDGAVVAQDLQGEQPVVQRGAGAAAGEDGRGGGVEEDEIGLLAGQERADPVGDAHHPRAAGGGEVKRAEGVEAGAPQLAGPVRLAERVEHREGRARADVGADADS